MLKVLLAINVLQYKGGAEVFFYNLCREIAKDKNISLLVVSLYGNVNPAFKDLLNGKIPFKTINKKSSFDFKSFRKFRKIVKEFNPDIINTHLSCLITYYFAFGSKKMHWKIIHTVHSVANKEATKFDLKVRRKLLKKNNLYFISISDSVDDTVKELYCTNQTNIIYNGTNFAIDMNKKYRRNNRIICIANYRTEKNHKMLFDVVNELFNDRHYSNWELVCFGAGELIEDYKIYVSQLKNASKISLNGSTNEVREELLQSKIFALSSTFEGNPISILEALSCGVPIVAPRVGGIPDIIKEGYNGYMFEVSNNADMLSKLKMLIDKLGDDSLQKNCFESAKKYDIKNTAVEYTNLFKKLLEFDK